MSLDERLKYAAMKSRHVNAAKPWRKKWWGVLSIIFVTIILIILIACFFYIYNKMQEIRQGKDEETLAKRRQTIISAINGNTNYFIGATSPQATVVEFGDFACPFCLESEKGVKEALTKYPDKMKLVWRDYPLHVTSIDLAMAARCAGEQGKFWPYHDLLFSHQAEMATTTGPELTTQLNALAQSLGLNTGVFAACLDSQKYLDQIRQDYKDGELLQVQGTPTWFINNYPVTGSIPPDKFPLLIKGLIK